MKREITFCSIADTHKLRVPVRAGDTEQQWAISPCWAAKSDLKIYFFTRAEYGNLCVNDKRNRSLQRYIETIQHNSFVVHKARKLFVSPLHKSCKNNNKNDFHMQIMKSQKAALNAFRIIATRRCVVLSPTWTVSSRMKQNFQLLFCCFLVMRPSWMNE